MKNTLKTAMTSFLPFLIPLSFLLVACQTQITPAEPDGSSDSDPGRTLLDWPEDVAKLADHLGLEKFSILAYSGGAPFALSCAFKIPEVKEAMMNTMHLALSSGIQGAKDDVKIETARYVSETLPNCEARFMENEGHLTLIYKYAGDILITLTKAKKSDQ